MVKRSWLHQLIAGPEWQPAPGDAVARPAVVANARDAGHVPDMNLMEHLRKAGIVDTGSDAGFRGADWDPNREGLYFAGDKPVDAHPGADFLPFFTLRAAAEMTICSPFVMRMAQDIASFSMKQDSRYGFGCRIQRRGEGQSGRVKSLTKAEEGEIKSIWDMLNRIEPFHRTMAKVAYDSMTYDWATSEILYEESGRPYAFRALDAATVRKGRPRKQRGGRDNYVTTSFVQVIDNTNVAAVWHPDEIWALVRNPRTGLQFYGYGYPETQRAYDSLRSWFRLDRFNDNYFTNGTLANSLLLFYGEMTPAKWKALREIVTAQLKGYENAHRMAMALLAPGGDGKPGDKFEKIDFMKSNVDMQFTDLSLMKIMFVAAAFNFSTPREVGLPEYRGAGSPLSQGSDKEDFLLAREGRLRPPLVAIQDGVNHNLVYRYNEDFEFSYVFDRESEEARAKIIGEQVSKGLISYNEGRERMGDERVDDRFFKKHKIVIPGDEKGEKQAAYIAAMSLPMTDSLQRAIGVLMPAPPMPGMDGGMGGEGDDMGDLVDAPVGE